MTTRRPWWSGSREKRNTDRGGDHGIRVCLENTEEDVRIRAESLSLIRMLLEGP